MTGSGRWVRFRACDLYGGISMQHTKTFLATALLGLAAAALLSSAARADCNVDSEPFFMHLQDTTKHTINTDPKGCELNFATDGKTKFRSAAVVSQPKSGKVAKVAGLEFVYHPKPGFKGTDAFTMKVCGSTPAGKGCSTLNYVTVVE